MKSFFSIDNPVFQAISRVGDMFILSFFVIATGFPIITLGASITALFDVCMRILRKRDKNILKDYFRAFKNNFRQATIIWLIMVVIGAVLYIDIKYWFEEYGTAARAIGAISIGLAFIYTAILHYIFAVQAVFENRIKATFKTAFLMSLKHWPSTLALLASTAALVYLCLFVTFYRIVIYAILVVGIGAFGMIYSVRLLTIFRKYNSDLEPLPDESNNEPILQLSTNKKKDISKINYGKSKVIK
ncbi:MAG: YesL family protein [Eubacterium sp.]|jgi:uncharacterized membrane protein YesL|nr:YesL family protein [Eubacterium sp.]